MGLGIMPAEAADAYLKGAVIVHPRSSSLSNRWFVSFGNDFSLGASESVFLGFEVQTAFYRVPLLTMRSEHKADVLPLHGFLNFKYKTGRSGFRPYGGAGAGFVTFITAVREHTWFRQSAFHLVGGIEIRRVVVELQATRSFDKVAEFSYTLLFGVVW